MTSLIPSLRLKINNFAFLQYVFYTGWACYSPFITVFLLDKKVNATTIGTILAVNSMISIIAQPGWGMVSDRVRSVKRVFMALLFASALLIFFLPFFHTTLAFVFIFPFIMLFLSPLQPLMDNWVIQGIKRQAGTAYGSSRLWGSIGFAVMAVIMGKVISIFPVNVTFFVFAAIAVLTLLLCTGIPNPAGSVGGHSVPAGTGSESSKSILRSLLKNYLYVTFIVLSCVFNIFVVPMVNFLPKFLEHIGGSTTLYGWAIAVGAMSEVPVLYFSRRLIAKFRPLTLIMTAFVFFIIRLSLYSLFSSPAVVLLAQSMQGLSYGLFLAGSLYYMDLLAPRGTKATAVTLGSALYYGLSGIVGNYMSGRIIDSYGIVLLYRIGFFACIAVLLLFLGSVLYGRKLTQEEPRPQSAP